MEQTSVDNCNNLNLDPEMCLRRGKGVQLQTRVPQTKLHNLKSRFGGPDLQFPHWIRACNSSQRVLRLMFAITLGSFVTLFKHNLLRSSCTSCIT